MESKSSKESMATSFSCHFNIESIGPISRLIRWVQDPLAILVNRWFHINRLRIECIADGGLNCSDWAANLLRGHEHRDYKARILVAICVDESWVEDICDGRDGVRVTANDVQCDCWTGILYVSCEWWLDFEGERLLDLCTLNIEQGCWSCLINRSTCW